VHNLLKRQIKRFLGNIDSMPQQWLDFISAVDQAYSQSDIDREMLERSLEISSQELLQANSEMQAILTAIPDLFFHLDESGAIIYHKAGKDKDLFIPSKNLIGKRIQNIPMVDVGKKFKRAIEKVKKTQHPVIIEYSLIIARKKNFYEARLLPLFQNQTIVIIRNITKAKISEQTLIEEKERLAVTLRSIGDAVITTDIDGNIMLINSVAEELTGWKLKEAVGKPINEIFNIRSIKGELCENPVEMALKSGEIIELNRSVLTDKDGREKTIADSAAPIKYQRNKIIGSILVFRDITEQLKLEEEILKRQKLESIGILAGGLAHDFNNALSAILGNITIAKIGINKYDTSYERLTMAETATYRARELAQQLLTFAKGGTPVKKSSNLEKLLSQTIKFVLSGSNTDYKLDVASDLWQVEIDEGQIIQVFNNLIINADQAMPEGGTVYVRAINSTHMAPDKDNHDQREQNYVKITIRDEGVGITPENLSRIFDPYFTTKEKGSGLGLATSYSIIKKHDGYIEVESEIGKGTIFNIYIPKATKEAMQKNDEHKDQNFKGSGRILVMDDDKLILDMACQLLELFGYETESADDGLEAIKKYREAIENGTAFDAVIMDLTVAGGMGGKEAICALLEIDPEVKAVVSSGYSHDPVMSNYKSYGFKDILLKPYRKKDLGKTISMLLKQK